MPNFELWHSCLKWAIYNQDLFYSVKSLCNNIFHFECENQAVAVFFLLGDSAASEVCNQEEAVIV
jgi:hypothetical protein